MRQRPVKHANRGPPARANEWVFGSSTGENVFKETGSTCDVCGTAFDRSVGQTDEWAITSAGRFGSYRGGGSAGRAGRKDGDETN